MTHTVARNLNRIIDINYYPVESARRSNMRHRPIGIGVQVGPSMASTPSMAEPWHGGCMPDEAAAAAAAHRSWP